MTDQAPASVLDDINRLRVEKEHRAVDALAEEIWSSWLAGRIVDPAGLAAMCQVAFISAQDATEADMNDIFAKARLWRARATSAAVRTGELNTVAMLMVPMAFQANAMGEHAAALSILDEVGYLVDEFERLEDARRAACDQEGLAFRPAPGVSLLVLRRAQFEKAGYLLWRQARYAESLAKYREARVYAMPNTRDAVRVDGGELLASLGIEEADAGPLDAASVSAAFSRLADVATEGHWLDVEGPLRHNAAALASGSIATVQDLRPLEIE